MTSNVDMPPEESDTKAATQTYDIATITDLFWVFQSLSESSRDNLMADIRLSLSELSKDPVSVARYLMEREDPPRVAVVLNIKWTNDGDVAFKGLTDLTGR